jgi:CSLREA domain-containing protein
MRRLASTVLVCILLAGPAQSQALGAQLSRPLAAGATYAVNSTADLPDVDLGTSACLTISGTCTLRAAIMQANFVSGPNTITVPSGVYLLTRPGVDDAAILGDLDITDQLIIQGAGPGATVVDGNSAVTDDRVFQVLESAADVTLMDLTIRNGSVPTSGVSGPSKGGGILADSPSGLLKLTLNDVVLEGNSALTGGGLYASATKVNLKNSTVRNNAADAGGGVGGGIDAAFGSTLTMQDSQVYSNTAYEGGGLAIEGNLNTDIQRSQFYSKHGRQLRRRHRQQRHVRFSRQPAEVDGQQSA